MVEVIHCHKRSTFAGEISTHATLRWSALPDDLDRQSIIAAKLEFRENFFLSSFLDFRGQIQELWYRWRAAHVIAFSQYLGSLDGGEKKEKKKSIKATLIGI